MTKPFRLRAPVPLEDDIHGSVADLLTIAIAPPGIASDRGVMWWTVEHRNARSAAEGRNRKRRGVVAGVWDVFVLSCGTLIGIELKRPGYADSDVRDSQRRFHANADKAGASTFIATSADDVLRGLRTMAVPMRKLEA